MRDELFNDLLHAAQEMVQHERAPSKADALAMTSQIELTRWATYGLTVTRDGYDPETGTRIHFVLEPGWSGQMIGNAFIYSE